MIVIKTLKLIYNANAGNRSFKNELDTILKIFTYAQYDISILRADTMQDIAQCLGRASPNQYHTIVAAGGDGTLNAVINGVIKSNLKTKIGIIPAGTANDFARFLKIEKPYTAAAEIITKGRTIPVDIGKANESYFINVFGAGTLTNISHYVDAQLKNTLGNMAYYLKAIEKLQSFTATSVIIKNSHQTLEENIYFFVALNSWGAGGFDKIAESASVQDGYFDMLAVKKGNITELMALLMKFIKGEHMEDEHIIYYRDNYTELIFNDFVDTNIDGENGPPTPVRINVIPQAIEVFVPDSI
ncbi:MAG: YegS/Rv2252/BmrU family lipid kinase [Defluviitaleaceae bacterium]|nr:YegS/Rv2252/BmrU family lipid kinase [Defluviitaleaceae bacterium]